MKQIYSNDFIKSIIEQYKSGKSVTNLSTEFNIQKETLYKWINQNKNKEKKDDIELSKSEIIALKRRIKELEMENAILEKAISPFDKRKILILNY